LSDLGAKIALIAPPKTGDALRARAAGKILTVNQNQDYAFAAYGLLTRTFADPKVDAARVPIEHVEFLIDRSGYIRGRWIPSQESGAGGWGDLSLLEEQLQLLAKEPLRAPPQTSTHIERFTSSARWPAAARSVTHKPSWRLTPQSGANNDPRLIVKTVPKFGKLSFRQGRYHSQFGSKPSP